MHKPTKVAFRATKHILRYLAGIVNFGIMFRRHVNRSLLGFSDSD